MNRAREQWAALDAQFCAKQNSAAANFHLIRDAQQDISELHRELDQAKLDLNAALDLWGQATCELVTAVKAQLHWLDEPDHGKFDSGPTMLQKADGRVRAAIKALPTP